MAPKAKLIFCSRNQSMDGAHLNEAEKSRIMSGGQAPAMNMLHLASLVAKRPTSSRPGVSPNPTLVLRPAVLPVPGTFGSVANVTTPESSTLAEGTKPKPL